MTSSTAADFSPQDEALMAKVRACQPALLGELDLPFQDARLAKMLFLYKGRNYPHLLNEKELKQWYAHCNSSVDKDAYLQKIQSLIHEQAHNPRSLQLLHHLVTYIS